MFSEEENADSLETQFSFFMTASDLEFSIEPDLTLRVVTVSTGLDWTVSWCLFQPNSVCDSSFR